MRLFLNETIIKYGVIRAVFLGSAGILTLLFPEFLLSKSFYALLTGYILLSGILEGREFWRYRKSRNLLCYGSLILGCILFLSGIHFLLFSRYLIPVIPVILGGLLLLEGFVCFLGACCSSAPAKGFMYILALIPLFGGIVVLIFTFGFGIGGRTELVRVSGTALLSSCLCEMIACLNRKKKPAHVS